MVFKWGKKKKKMAGKKKKDNQQPLINNKTDETSQEPDEIESEKEVPLQEEKETGNSDEEKEVTDQESFLIADEEKKRIFSRLRGRLSKTRKNFVGKIEKIFSGKKMNDEECIEELEEMLITTDLGVHTVMDIMEKISEKLDKNLIENQDGLKNEIKKELLSLMPEFNRPQITDSPHIILVVGVNGAGKTTTIGKMALKYTKEGKKVLIAAADTFRAAAIEQLQQWAERSEAEFISHKENSDPAAVVFDAVQAAVARKSDIVFIDTAGRLHTNKNLMEELKKIKRTISKKIPNAPHETILVLDATTGQNALSQAKLFNEDLDITGLILTKLDGTAKGGIVLSICNELKIPIDYIGIGERIEDLQDFDANDFINALF